MSREISSERIEEAVAAALRVRENAYAPYSRFHVGAANGQANGVGYNATAFYQFDAGASGLNTFTFARPGLSNARLFLTGSAPIIPPPCSGLNCGSSVFGSAAVPEPAAWALMILGFGGVGTMLRRRRMALA